MVAESAPVPVADARAHDMNLDPCDYDSLWYRPLRLCGVTPERLAGLGVHVLRLRDERACRPDEAPSRVWWRYPIWDDEGRECSARLAAVDGTWPRSDWLGPPRPDLLYAPHLVVPGAPVVVCGDVLGVWALASAGIAACTFLCGPHADVPAPAVRQLAGRRPSRCLVVDNETPALPRHAPAVVRALRAVGLPAAYVNLWTYATRALGTADATAVDLVAMCGGRAAAIWARLAELQRERAP